jgi:hypothetical protein
MRVSSAAVLTYIASSCGISSPSIVTCAQQHHPHRLRRSLAAPLSDLTSAFSR